jgi:hypothetical protein
VTNSEKKEEWLFRESRWLRVYKLGSNHFRSESKFRSDGLQVSADSIIGQWSSLSLDEQIEFSNAYRRKPSLTSEDERILNFLMEVGPPGVWVNIALLLCRHPDRERVFRFLASRAGEDQDHRANFYSGLETFNDPRSIPILKRQYEKYRNSEALLKRGPLDRSDSSQLFDYLYCCRALMSIEGSPEYQVAIKEFLTHSDNSLRKTAERLLSQTPGREPPKT